MVVGLAGAAVAAVATSGGDNLGPANSFRWTSRPRERCSQSCNWRNSQLQTHAGPAARAGFPSTLHGVVFAIFVCVLMHVGTSPRNG